MKLSIITVNLNNADGLRKTIESVVSQTFTDYEYIVVDGASTDGSVDIIKQYADKITFWISEPDSGIYNAMNKGVLKAKGDYLQFLNSGDWLAANDILKYVFDLDRQEDVLYGDEFLFYNTAKIERKTYPKELTFYDFFVGSISHEGSFYKRCLFRKPYDETFKIASDWDFEIREIIIYNQSVFKISREIIYFDMHGISQSQKYLDLQNHERMLILSKYFPERIILDYKFIAEQRKIVNYSLYPYVEIFSRFSTSQRIVRGFMKLMLKLSGNKKLIPKK